MRKKTRLTLWVLAVLCLALLTACGGGEMPQVVAPSELPAQTESDPPAPESSVPVESEEPPVESEEPPPENGVVLVLAVDGVDLPAQEYRSPLGYALLYPQEELVTVNPWEGGETFMVSGSEGTYLSACCLDAPSLNVAAEALQFEYAIEGEPTGRMFGSEGYAGMSMISEMEGLSIEYILCEEGEVIYLLEVAIQEDGQEYRAMLYAMLDSFTVLT